MEQKRAPLTPLSLNKNNGTFSRPEDKQKKVVKIILFYKKVLGKGRNSKVYTGLYEGIREVAIKRIDEDELAYFKSETEILCAAGADNHLNIIRYFGSEVDDEFRYIALELCDATLAEWVDKHEKTFKFGKVDNIELLRQSAEGLNFLHKNKIVHRDVKPSNILLKKDGNEVVVKISDFGLGKRLPKGKDDYTNSGKASGTEGWRAPEVIRANKNERLNSKVDVWSFGKVIYYVLTGNHPNQALKGKLPLEKLDNSSQALDLVFPSIPNDFFGIRNLIYNYMVPHDPKRRCAISFVLRHPMFWSTDNILSFFNAVWSCIDNNKKTLEMQKAVENFENASDWIFPISGDQGWTDQIDIYFRRQLYFFKDEKKEFYNGKSAVHLIKAIRNKHAHYHELSNRARMEIGGKSNYVKYFLQRFPNLLEYTYRPFICLRHLEEFQGFYPTSTDFNDAREEIMWAKGESEMAHIASTESYSKYIEKMCPIHNDPKARKMFSFFTSWHLQDLLDDSPGTN